ncbi:MAG TPA: serpin family protein [Actinopolymorphaceae bacterium]|jgi:serpin B
MSGLGDVGGIVQTMADRASPRPGELAAGTAVVRSVAAKLLAPLLAAHSGENVAFSPLSIALALGMLRAGAQGDSAAELDALFGLDGSFLPAALNAVDQRLAELDGGDPKRSDGFDGNAHVSLANALWGQDGITWREPFLDTLAADYGTGVHTVDYRADPEACRQLINAWVKDQTHGKIPELLVRGSITGAHVLALTNALWFKARWMHQFSPSATGPFTTSSGSRVNAPRMVSRELMRYDRGPGWQSVQIPYVGGHLAVTVVLPDPGLQKTVERSLATDTGMLALLQPNEVQTVHLTMPRFDVDTATALLDVLSATGVRSPFVAGTGDFDPMTADAVVWIDRVAHQATVTVDEQGTEAAAATAVMGVAASVRRPVEPVTVVVDRPFYFAITTTDDLLPLFLGRVTDPTTK